MERKTVMSGMRPTGALHLGHWEGALKSWLQLQQTQPTATFPSSTGTP